MKKTLLILIVFTFTLFSQTTIPFQYGWPRQASSDWGLYTNSPTIDDINNSGTLEISVTKSFATPELFVWRPNGTFSPGFPKTFNTGNLQNSGSTEISAFGDVTGDGFMEIVFGDENGQLFIFKYNGTMVPGTPFNLGANRRSTTPALVDVDGDSTLEIIITSYDRDSPYLNAKLHLLKYDGTNFLEMPNFPIEFSHGGESAPVAGDITGDGNIEIAFITNGNVGAGIYAKLNLIDITGENLIGFPIDLTINNLGSTPALYDLNKDGKLEIILRTNFERHGVNGIYAFDSEGAIFPNFPFPCPFGNPYSNVAIADMTGDGFPEIAYGSVRAVDSGMVWAWNLQGDLLPNYPRLINATWVDGAVVLADVSGDSLPDVIAPTSKGFIYAFDKNGQLVNGFPLEAEDVHVVKGFNCSPTVTDIDGDDDVEIFAGSLNRRVYGWDTPGIYVEDNVWHTYKGNAQRTGGQLRGWRPTNIKDENIRPDNFVLSQNFPNPFNPSTVISYQLPVDSKVLLKVYDILGNEVETLVNEFQSAGNYNINFSKNSIESGKNLTSGVYFYTLRASEFLETKKMVLMK